ncbi:MAG: hypothetical protein WB609_05575 [Candidatus Cybelea sp.]
MLNPITSEEWSEQLRSALTPPSFVREAADVRTEQGSTIYAYRALTVYLRPSGQSVAATFVQDSTGATRQMHFALTRDGVVRAAAAIGMAANRSELPDEDGSGGIL